MPVVNDSEVTDICEAMSQWNLEILPYMCKNNNNKSCIRTGNLITHI